MRFGSAVRALPELGRRLAKVRERACMLLVSFGADLQKLITQHVVVYLPKLATGLVVLLVSWLCGRMLSRGIDRMGQLKGLDTDLVSFFGRMAYATLMAIGAVTALGTMGIDVTALVAGLGLTGVVLGLALKDIVSNAVSGVLILMYKPFRRTDLIAVSGMEGTVQEVNLRYTVLKSDGQTIFVPNSILFTNAITVGARAIPPATT